MSRLTEREQAVLDKRNAGLTFKQISEDLGLCPATVSFAYRKAYRKIEYGKAMKISKLTEYELLGSIEDIKSIHQANQSCEKILETSLMVSQNNRLLSHELEVYKSEVKQLKSEQNKVAVEKLEEVLKKVKQVVIVTDDDNDDYSPITLWGLKKVINSIIKELKGEK